MKHETETAQPAPLGQVERGVRPHAIRLASQLQSAAYSHGYEDGHPSNATTRQDKYSAASQRLLTELREAIELLISERDGLMQTLRDEMDENLRLRELGGAQPDENITALTERLIRERDALRETGQPERELVSLLKDVLHCSDVFATFRPDLHARLLEFGRQLRQQAPCDEFNEVRDAA